MKGRLLKRSILLVAFSLSFLVGCEANAYHPSKDRYVPPLISDLSIKHAFTKTISEAGRRIRVSLYYQSDGEMSLRHLKAVHSELSVEGVVRRSSGSMNSFLATKRMPTQDCRGSSYNINIFVVSKEVLMQKSRFKGFIKKRFGSGGHNNITSQAMWLHGYYDSTLDIENNSIILVTDLSIVTADNFYNEEVLAHELGHYFWDRLCLSPHTTKDPETFAIEFQSYYRRVNR